MKTCSKCKMEKTFDSFHKAKTAKDGHQCWCKECMSAFRAENRDEYRRRAAAAYQNTKAMHSVYGKLRREEHGGRIKEQKREAYLRNSQRIIDKTAAWRKANPEQYRSQGRKQMAKRRAQLVKALPAWANSAAIAVFYVTAEALGMHTGEWYHVDHIVPLNSKLVCGLHCEANLQVLLGTENMSKNNRYWPDMPDRIDNCAAR